MVGESGSNGDGKVAPGGGSCGGMRCRLEDSMQRAAAAAVLKLPLCTFLWPARKRNGFLLRLTARRTDGIVNERDANNDYEDTRRPFQREMSEVEYRITDEDCEILNDL